MTTALKSIGEVLAKCSDRLNHGLFVLAAAATGLMAVPTVLDVAYRLFFSRSIPGVVELVEFSMVVLVFGSLGFLQDGKAHIRVDLLVNKFPLSAQRGLELFSSICAFVLIALMAWCLWTTAGDKVSSGEVSAMLGIPIHLFVYFAALGAAAFALSLLADTARTLARLTEDHQRAALAGGLLLSALVLSMAFLIKDSPLADNLLLLGSLGMAFLMGLLLLGMPIGIGMAVVGYTGMVVLYPNLKSSLSMLGLTPYTTSANYVYSVVPMFILMGELAMHSGISRDLFTAASVWLGRLPGGLAIASISGCAGFAAVSGDSMATAVTMASVALPEMKKKRYDPGLSCASLAAGGTLGILIPPSTGFIFYSLVTEVSIGKLFVAGIIPGLLLTGIFIGIILLFAHRRPDLAPRGEAATSWEKLRALKGVLAMVLLIALILGGILSGWFSPNEGGAVGAAATCLYAVIRRRLTWNNFLTALRSTAQVTASLLLILIGVGLLSYFFAATALPFDLADMVVGLDANRYVIFAAVVAFYIVLGALMNVIPMILLTLPAIFPSITGLGFDPVWFGVVVVILMEMGQITPPVGINVFALSSVATDVPMVDIFRRMLPFFCGMLFLVAVLVLCPGLATWLPDLLI